MKILIAFSMVVSALGALAAPGDWPQWRGPNRDGVSAETGLLKQWPTGGPRIAWRAGSLGVGYSSVTLLGNRICTLGDQADDCFVIALSRTDGKRVWSAKLGKAGASGWGGFEGPRSTPSIDDGLVVALGQWGELLCLDANSGKEKWRKDLTSDFDATRPEWGYAESPLIDGEKVLVTPGGSRGAVVALDKKSGDVIWQSKEFTDPAHYSSLIIAEIDGVRQYIQLTESSIVGLAAADGKVLWRAPRQGRTAVIPTPIYYDHHVYVTSGYGVGCNLFKISESSGKFTATQVYANKEMANHHGGVIRVGDYVYGHSDGKGWTCQQLASGHATWQEKAKLGKGSIACADGLLYLRAEDGKGTVALIEASADGWKEHGRFNQPDRSDKNSWPHPVVAGGRLYLRDQDLLFCYDIKAK